MPDKPVQIAMAGGGIGGLAAALALLQAGFDVHVYEQSSALREVGAGIQVSPNAARILHRYGLSDELARVGVRPIAWHQRRWDDGRTLLRTPLGEDVIGAFGFPHYQCHRADVLAMLTAAVPVERVHLGHRLSGFSDRGASVDIQFDNGVGVRADMLIGADGIHSAVRRILFGEQQPEFTGCMAYRGLVPAERLKHLDLEVVAQIWMGPGKHVVNYFVASGRLMNFVANIEQDGWTRESWTDRGDPNELRAAFAAWAPELRAVFAEVEETFIWGLFDRAPLPRWSVGRVTLLGDACHPMLPYMAQGAAQALEDGAVLAACLAKNAEVEGALKHYEDVRLPRASKVQLAARGNKTRFHLPDGPEQIERDALMASSATDWSFKAIDWLYGHDAVADV
ncbi:MAG TPA: FAD-dependent monooxygenase [Pseudolabrys sp.]|nr:FAD-dependent monooxygenase [Pseudolabrys sp.]